MKRKTMALTRVEVLLALLLVVAATGAGCAVTPLSVHQTLPSTRAALAGLAAAQRSLDEAGTYPEKNREAVATVRPVAAHGATHAAYQRWANDEVRELPEPQESVIIAGGDT